MNFKKNYFNTTAVLLFAQSENAESTAKPIASSLKQNILLWKKMNNLALKTIVKTKLPYFISDEENQVGQNFGEKITNSIQEIFAKGYEKIIVIGNDCILLKSQHILKAAQELQKNDFVVGADYSGGAYLMGVSKTTFKAPLFKEIPWQTKFVFTSLQSLYETKSVALLPRLDDCNSTADFKKVVNKLHYLSLLKKLLLSFLFLEKSQNKFEKELNDYNFPSLKFNKGSPTTSEIPHLL